MSTATRCCRSSSTCGTASSTSPRSRPRTGTSGSLDVVVNAAGYGHYGAVEEVTEEEARAIMDTNFFGALWITQAALPFLRAQGGGHILQVSSVGGLVAGSSLGVVPRQQVGARGHEHVACGRGRKVGDQGHDRRAHRLQHGRRGQLAPLHATSRL